jgi:hypothetical protein
MIKQKEAVFNAYQTGINNGLQHGGDQLFEAVAADVSQQIAAGGVEYGKDRSDEKAVKSYGRALTSNWFKKDERISGAKYVPATRRGPQVKDDTLKKLSSSLKALKIHNGDMTLIAKVEAAVETRRAELQAAKASSKVQSLDDTLQALEELGIRI